MTMVPIDLTSSLKPRLESDLLNSQLEEFALAVHELAQDILQQIGLAESSLLGTAQIGHVWDQLITDNIASEKSAASQLISAGLVLYKRWHVQRKRRSVPIGMTFRDYLAQSFSGDLSNLPGTGHSGLAAEKLRNMASAYQQSTNQSIAM